MPCDEEPLHELSDRKSQQPKDDKDFFVHIQEAFVKALINEKGMIIINSLFIYFL